jgi:hypothetical protein
VEVAQDSESTPSNGRGRRSRNIRGMPEPAASSSSRRSDRLATLVSGLVAMLALGVSTYNVYLQRQQIRAQVYPRLSWGHGNLDGFTYDVRNSGVGPAEIAGLCVRVDGQPVTTWRELLDRLPEKPPREPIMTSGIGARVLAPGELVHALQLRAGRSAELLNAQLDHVRTVLCYCSTLGECWETSGFKAVAVAECTPCPRPFED